MSIRIRVYPQYAHSPALRARKRAQALHRAEVRAARIARQQLQRQMELARFQSFGGLGSAWGGASLPYSNFGFGGGLGYSTPGYAVPGYGAFSSGWSTPLYAGTGYCQPSVVQRSPWSSLTSWMGW